MFVKKFAVFFLFLHKVGGPFSHPLTLRKILMKIPTRSVRTLTREENVPIIKLVECSHNFALILEANFCQMLTNINFADSFWYIRYWQKNKSKNLLHRKISTRLDVTENPEFLSFSTFPIYYSTNFLSREIKKRKKRVRLTAKLWKLYGWKFPYNSYVRKKKSSVANPGGS